MCHLLDECQIIYCFIILRRKAKATATLTMVKNCQQCENACISEDQHINNYTEKLCVWSGCWFVDRNAKLYGLFEESQIHFYESAENSKGHLIKHHADVSDLASNNLT